MGEPLAWDPRCGPLRDPLGFRKVIVMMMMMMMMMMMIIIMMLALGVFWGRGALAVRGAKTRNRAVPRWTSYTRWTRMRKTRTRLPSDGNACPRCAGCPFPMETQRA